jgi:hypothetical protein
MDVESLAKQLILQNMTPEQQSAVLESVRATLQEARGNQKRRVSENVGMVVDALKKIEADIRAKYDDLGQKITDRVNSVRDGVDGIDGRDGKDGKDGRPGRDGVTGPMGPAGRDGIDGVDGEDGVSVIDAKIDFDGSLVITLSNGREINVGEVVAPDLAERIKVITNGGGTSQTVIDTLVSLQAQIDAIEAEIALLTSLTYKGTWNASTNTPTLASSVGAKGDYYIVSVAGSTNLNGITDWQPGDWVIFNGTVWQKIDQSWATAGVNNNITSMTGITGGISSPDFIQFDTGATVTNAAGRLYWDATQQTLTVGLNANIAADIGQTLYAYATNAESVTITKGQPVYMFAAQGDRVSVKLAYNTGDATSAKTLGVCAEDIGANQAGMILCQGVQDGLNLGAYTAGDTLYLGATAGTLTNTKPYAPNHLVYIGVVERANAGNGRLYVRVQNGYEMDELHNVSAQNPSNGQVLIYNASTSLWEKNTLTDGTGITITEGAGSITITNAAPDQTVALTGAGTTSISGTYPNFTITSNDQYVGTVTSVTGTSPVASSGGATPAISLASGYGDTQNPYASKTANFVLAAPNGSAGVPTFRAIVAADIPTLNQNTTGTASNITGTVAIANGGTGQTTATAAFNALAPNQTGNSGRYLTTDGSTTSWATVSSAGTVTSVAATVPAFLSVTGSPITTSGTLAISYSGTALPIANGGTGETSRQTAMNAFAGAVTSGQYLRGNGTNVVMSAIQAADVPTLNQNTTGSSASCTGNSATATNLSTNRNNWSTNGTLSAVVGQLVWRNYGNGHTIFDASASLSPDGTSVNNTNSQVAWTGTYPTLMGWNGSNTYGVRVDSARLADALSTVVGSAPSYAARAWVNFNGTGTVAIRASGNVTSITDNGVGDYSVNFTTAMPDTSYVANVSAGQSGGNQQSGINMFENRSRAAVSPTTSQFQFTTFAGGAFVDHAQVLVSVFR